MLTRNKSIWLNLQIKLTVYTLCTSSFISNQLWWHTEPKLWQQCHYSTILSYEKILLTWVQLPRLERVLDLSIIGLLLRTDLLAKDRSAVTRVIEILRTKAQSTQRNIESENFESALVNTTGLSILLTFLQICVSESQKELSASCPSPLWEDKKLNTQTWKKNKVQNNI